MTVVSQPVRVLFRTASVLAFVAVMMGAVVCATNSGFECGNWPGCTERTLLPGDTEVVALFYKNPWIEMIHRTSAILAGPAALAVAVLALRLKGVSVWVKVLPWLAVLGAVIAGVVGRGIVLGAVYPTWVGAADLFAAVGCMATLVVATVALERGGRCAPSPAGRYAWAAVGLLVVAHLVALWTATTGSYTRCMSWPVWTAVPGDDLALSVVRYGLYVAAAVATWLTVRGIRHRSPRLAVTLVVLLGLLLVLGPIIGWLELAVLGFAYSSLTVALLAVLVWVAALESFGVRPGAETELVPPNDPVSASRP